MKNNNTGNFQTETASKPTIRLTQNQLDRLQAGKKINLKNAIVSL